MKVRITYPNGTSVETYCVLKNGYLCRQTTVQKGYKFVKVRTNPDLYNDEPDPEYETRRIPNWVIDYKAIFNKMALEADNKVEEAQNVAKKAKTFEDYRHLQEYFYRLGENREGILVEAI